MKIILTLLVAITLARAISAFWYSDNEDKWTRTTSKGYAGLTSTQKCNMLEKAFSDYLNHPSEAQLLQMIASRSRRYRLPGEEEFKKFTNHTGYDILNNPQDLHKVSCIIAEAKSIDDIAEAFNAHRKDVEFLIKNSLPHLIKESGSLDNLVDIGVVASLLVEWASYTDWPITPAKRVYEMTTLTVFEKVREEMKKVHVERIFKRAPFPFKVTPSTAVHYLRTAKTLSELADGVKVNERDLKAWTEPEVRKFVVPSTTAQVLSQLRLLQSLEQCGIFDLN